MLLRHEGFRRLCEARELLREVSEPSLTIAEVGAIVRISPFHLIRQFEAVFGLTPHQFRMKARLELARDLLARGQHSVTDVCMTVGFSSLGSFSALFTREIGESPSAYRRRVRGVIPDALTPGCLSLLAHLPPSALAAPARNFREA